MPGGHPARLAPVGRERAADTPVQRLVDIAAVATELGHLEADFTAALEEQLPATP